MQAKEDRQRVFTWPWLITAWLSPVLLFGIVAYAYLVSLDKLQKPIVQQAQNSIKRIEAEHADFKEEMRLLIERSGYGIFKPVPVSQPVRGLPTLENQEIRPFMKEWAEYEQSVLNDMGGNSISDMRGEGKALAQWRQEMVRNLAWKLYDHYYSLKDAIAAKGNEGEGATIAALQKLRRDASAEDSEFVRPQDQAVLDDALKRFEGQEEPQDLRLHRSQRPTIESIIRLQYELIGVLAEATAKQYILLYGKVDGWKQFKTSMDELVIQVDKQLKDLDGIHDKNTDVINTIRTRTESFESGWRELAEDVESPKDQSIERLQQMIRRYKQEVTAHEQDAADFHRLLQENKEVGDQFLISEVGDIDGRITYLDRDSRRCHISLGSDDGVLPGMRFEVYPAGEENVKQSSKAVVEVIRTLSPSFSLCVILDRLDGEEGKIHEGDSIINVFWSQGKYLSVALHGRYWGAPYTRYGKFQLEEILKDMGVVIHDKVQPNTDLVIGGGGLVFDQHYRESRKYIRFQVLPESQARLYVDPR